MNSQKLLQELQWELKQITDFIVNGNYSMILITQPQIPFVDDFPDQCRALANRLTAAADEIENEIKKSPLRNQHRRIKNWTASNYYFNLRQI